MLPRRLSKAAGGCAVLFLIPLLGCSIHPLPGDIPRVATVDIVERMRCEAQEGLMRVMNEAHRNQKVDAQIFEHTTIGYDFVFDVTESNNKGDPTAETGGSGGSLMLTRPRSDGGSFTLGLSASSLNKRENVRRFRIIEKFKDLAKVNCSQQATQANWVFPITGATGIDEIVRTYFKIERFGDLPLDSPAGASGLFPDTADTDHIVFSDVLTFTTTLSAGATPHLVLNASVGSLRVTDAMFTGAASRLDKHTVIVAIARDKFKIVREVRSGRVVVLAKSSAREAEGRAMRKLLVARQVVQDPRIVTGLIQKDETAYNRVLIELQRLRNLEDDQREAPRLLGEKLLEVMRTP
jgi:hypothetical protein